MNPLEEGDYLGDIVRGPSDFIYIIDSKVKGILVYQQTGGNKRDLTMIKKHQLENSPNCLLYVPDGGGLKDKPLMFIGEEEGILEIAEITPKGPIKLFE